MLDEKLQCCISRAWTCTFILDSFRESETDLKIQSWIMSVVCKGKTFLESWVYLSLYLSDVFRLPRVNMTKTIPFDVHKLFQRQRNLKIKILNFFFFLTSNVELFCWYKIFFLWSCHLLCNLWILKSMSRISEILSLNFL